MSFYDRLVIPEILLRNNAEENVHSVSSAAFEDDIVSLRSFSFVSETAETGS